MKSSYTDSLTHTTYECKYHIVFAPKFRRKEIYGKIKKDIEIVMMKYNIAFDKNNNPTFSYYRERLFLRTKNYKWERENARSYYTNWKYSLF